MKTKLLISLVFFILAVLVLFILIPTYEPLLILLAVFTSYILGAIGLVFLVLYLRETLNEQAP